MYFISMMLSTSRNRELSYRLESDASSRATCSADLARNFMLCAFRPQKVQWCFSPHQHPREPS